jgi:hypothetical protein
LHELTDPAGASAAEVDHARARAESIKVVHLKITGNHASMTLSRPAQGPLVAPYGAQRVHGRWLLSCCVGLPQGSEPIRTPRGLRTRDTTTVAPEDRAAIIGA